MSVVSNMERWGNSHRPNFLDFFRIVLGLYITYKGFHFTSNMHELEMTASGVNLYFAGAAIAHYVIFAHILGGPLIVFGLFTRFACLIQIPILIGAVIMVNYPKGFLSVGNHIELEISIAVLIGLFVFLIFGAGKYSIDAIRRKEMGVA